MAGNITEAYNEYFNTSKDTLDALKDLSHNISEFGADVSHIEDAIKIYNQTSDVDRSNIFNAVELIAIYLMQYGFDYKYDKKPFNSADLYNVLKSTPAYLRLMIEEDVIEDIIKTLYDANGFPKMHFGYGEDKFNGEFYFKLDDNVVTREELIRSGFLTYLVGFPISDLGSLKKLSYVYSRSETIMEAVVYECLCEDWFRDILMDLALYGLTVPEWCIRFDGTWMDATNQIADGFISICNPTNPKKVICVSTMYPGEYFITNMLVFKNIYETGYLSTVRFVDKRVPVAVISRDKKEKHVEDRVLKVPVFTDGNGEEVMLSDLVEDNYVYHEIFWRNIGG